MAKASDILENEMQKMMESVEEIIWSKQTYTVQDIYARSSFPILARVEDSFLGDHSTDSYSTGEILWIRGGIEQNRVIMESHKGECLSIPISNNFKIRRSNCEYENYQPLSDKLVESEIGEWNEISDTKLYNYKNDELWNKFASYDFRCMKIIGKHSMTFLTGFSLFDEMSTADFSPTVFKHHYQQTFVLGTGLNTHTFEKWTQLCEELAPLHDEPTLPGITLYSKEYNNREIQSMQPLSTDENEIMNRKEGSNGGKDQEDIQSDDKINTHKEYNNREIQSMQLLSTEDNINGGKHQEDIQSDEKINTHPEHLTSKSIEKERKKSKKSTRKLLKHPPDTKLEKTIKKSYKWIPRVIEQNEKNEENKYKTLILSSKETHKYYESLGCVPKNNCNFPLDLDKPQEQCADNISCWSQSDSLIHNKPNLPKTQVRIPNYYKQVLPLIPPSKIVVPLSTSNSEIPSSTSCYEIASSISECEYEEIGASTMHRLKNLKMNDGRISQKDDLPQDLKMLTLDQVQDCLNLLHLERLADKFKENDIDGIILCDLSKDMLINDLGLTRIEALKLRKFIDQKWLPNSS
ncbi:uncharacterized protein LOC117101263 [Anneissia japonica]|uniref:uncharacterized protein LOC117101263 n=1 Tax=Anneissia japonica TaxID=1529436 RepID=UPI001425888C|nr:uncharacterized protein LOC117101263 [Anneissia japonica]